MNILKWQDTYRWSWRLKALEHRVQAYFLSSLWISLCLASALELLNVFWHIRHWIIDRLPVPALADEPAPPVLSARGLLRCMPLGFVPDGDKVSLWLSTSSVLPDRTSCHTRVNCKTSWQLLCAFHSLVCASDATRSKDSKITQDWTKKKRQNPDPNNNNRMIKLTELLVIGICW